MPDYTTEPTSDPEDITVPIVLPRGLVARIEASAAEHGYADLAAFIAEHLAAAYEALEDFDRSRLALALLPVSSQPA